MAGAGKSPVDSERFKEVVPALKESLKYSQPGIVSSSAPGISRPVGEGHLDRVILLIDAAAAAGFAGHVKTVRERALEFCAAFG